MNVCFFHTNGIMPESGGISRITSNLTSLFRRKGLQVHLVGFRKLDVKYQYDDCQVFLPNQDNLECDINIQFLVDFLHKNNIRVIINQAALSEMAVDFLAAVKEKIDIKIISCIHNSILTPIDNFAYQKEYYLKRKNLSFIFWVLKLSPIRKFIKTCYKQKHRCKFKRIFDNSDKVINLVPELAKEFEELANVKLENKNAIIPNCLDTYKNKNEKRNIILWVGTVDMAVKRIDYMIEIWGKILKVIPDWDLKILGDGPGLDEAKELSNKYGLERISFVGRVNPQKFYENASILVVTSSHESFSLVTVEAMSNGVVPIVNNSFPAAKDITNNGEAGILVEAFNKKNMTNAIIDLCRNDTRRKELSKSAILFSHNFDFENIYRRWEKLLLELK